MSIELIKGLRVRTSLGMTACKKALEQANGDIDLAIETLQKQGLKKVDDLIIPLEGAVYASSAPNMMFDGAPANTRVFELNCQTDFGARSEVFQEALKNISQSIYDENINSVVKRLSLQLGEKVVLRRQIIITMPYEDGFVKTYNHQGGSIAVALDVHTANRREKKIIDFAEEIAMHIAAIKPLAVNRESLDTQLVEKKRANFMDEVKDKKPEMQTKIVEGKMNKWFSEVVLLEQESVVHPKKTVGLLVKEMVEECGEFSLGNFVRWERGEQI